MKQALIIAALLLSTTHCFAQESNNPSESVLASQDVAGLKTAKIDSQVESTHRAISAPVESKYDIHGNLKGYSQPKKYEFGSIICDPYGGYANIYGY
jgi:hypothetical protein